MPPASSPAATRCSSNAAASSATCCTPATARNGRRSSTARTARATSPPFWAPSPWAIPDQWVEERPSVWRYTGTFPSEVCNLIFNDGQSCGILRWRIEDLRQPGDWHYTGIGASSSADAGPGQRDGVLYLCSPTNPGRAYAGIECALWGQRRLVGGQHHVILENLSFRNAGVHGYQESHARNVVIRNCEFRFIGGAVWNLEHRIRFGNAVEFWDGASDVTVEGCLFDNIYDAAVTHQGGETRNIPERIYFRDNLFVDCGLAAYECREPSREVYFEHNTCINGGGGFSMQGETPPRRSDPYPQPVGYHVLVWMIDADTQPGRVYIRHNVFFAKLRRGDLCGHCPGRRATIRHRPQRLLADARAGRSSSSAGSRRARPGPRR